MLIHERVGLRDRVHVFRDRTHAGEVVAGMLAADIGSDASLLAIPAGGVPVADAIARLLGLALDVAVVSKITPTWNSEVGYGAVAFDGSVRLNRELIRRMGIDEAEVARGIEGTREKVNRRARILRGVPAPPELSGRRAVLVDDGLASGFTMRVAVDAIRKRGVGSVWIAVPTGPRRSVEELAPDVEALYCANVRGGWSFSVADAYQRWSDVDEAEAAEILARARRESSAGRVPDR
jgi:predicted phosphoribosyltransferase